MMGAQEKSISDSSKHARTIQASQIFDRIGSGDRVIYLISAWLWLLSGETLGRHHLAVGQKVPKMACPGKWREVD